MATMQPGDQVRIKSGGPPLTVVQVSEKEIEPIVVCVWFDRNHEFHRESLVAAALAKVEYAQPVRQRTYSLLDGKA